MATRMPKPADIIEIVGAKDAGDDETKTAADGVRVQLKMRELVNRVMERSGAKKNDVKTISEAVLAVLGTALAGGEDLNLPPLGKVMVKRDNEDEKARILTVKIRQIKPKPEEMN